MTHQQTFKWKLVIWQATFLSEWGCWCSTSRTSESECKSVDMTIESSKRNSPTRSPHESPGNFSTPQDSNPQLGQLASCELFHLMAFVMPNQPLLDLPDPHPSLLNSALAPPKTNIHLASRTRRAPRSHQAQRIKHRSHQHEGPPSPEARAEAIRDLPGVSTRRGGSGESERRWTSLP